MFANKDRSREKEWVAFTVTGKARLELSLFNSHTHPDPGSGEETSHKDL